MKPPPELRIRHLHQPHLGFSGPLDAHLESRIELPDAVRAWLRRTREAHPYLNDEQFVDYLARALPASLELLQRGFLISVRGAPTPPPRPPSRLPARARRRR